jgi:DNA-directed RNA polymerase specialized sigma24 family protein
VLARIVHEDPLGVRDQVAHALRSGAWLIDADRVLLRTFALVSRHALRYRGRPEVDVWIRALAEDAIAAILREDNEVERRGLAHAPTPVPRGPVLRGVAAPASRTAGTAAQPEPGREQGSAFAALARPLGLEPRAMGRACLAFNRLPLPERRAFHALVIAGRTLDEIASESGESATDIARRARRALDAVLIGASVSNAAPTAADSPRSAAKADDRSSKKNSDRSPEVNP